MAASETTCLLHHLPGLFDMVMIKDNHIAAAGGIAAAVKATEVCGGRLADQPGLAFGRSVTLAG